MDFASVREDPHKGLVQPALPRRLRRAEKKRIHSGHGAHDRTKAAATMRLVGVPVALEPLGEQFLCKGVTREARGAISPCRGQQKISAQSSTSQGGAACSNWAPQESGARVKERGAGGGAYFQTLDKDRALLVRIEELPNRHANGVQAVSAGWQQAWLQARQASVRKCWPRHQLLQRWRTVAAWHSRWLGGGTCSPNHVAAASTSASQPGMRRAGQASREKKAFLRRNIYIVLLFPWLP
jgi:hypothetical protein